MIECRFQEIAKNCLLKNGFIWGACTTILWRIKKSCQPETSSRVESFPNLEPLTSKLSAAADHLEKERIMGLFHWPPDHCSIPKSTQMETLWPPFHENLCSPKVIVSNLKPAFLIYNVSFHFTHRFNHFDHFVASQSQSQSPQCELHSLLRFPWPSPRQQPATRRAQHNAPT